MYKLDQQKTSLFNALKVTKDVINYIEDLKRANLYVQGTEDPTASNLKILKYKDVLLHVFIFIYFFFLMHILFIIINTIYGANYIFCIVYIDKLNFCGKIMWRYAK